MNVKYRPTRDGVPRDFLTSTYYPLLTILCKKIKKRRAGLCFLRFTLLRLRGVRGCRGHPRPDQLDRDRNILRLGHRIRLLVLPGQAGGEEGGDGSRGQAHRNQQLGNQVTCLPSPPLAPASLRYRRAVSTTGDWA